jgi:glycosyltransferase involved in cell wall biosynthesis
MGKRVFSIDCRTSTPHFPGVGRYVSELTAALVPFLGPDERLILIAPVGAQPAVDPDKVQVVSTPASPFSLSQQASIPRLLAQSSTHVYHSTYYLMPYRPAVPTVLTAYDLIPLLFPASVSRRARLFFRLCHRLALNAAQKIVAISETTRQDLLSRYRLSTDKVVTIPLGVSSRFQPASSGTCREVCGRYGLTGRYALYVGINKPHKNLARLLQAWEKVCRQGDARLTLVMAGPWDARYDTLRAEAHTLGIDGKVRFLGPVPLCDLPGLYTGADLFVFPSLYEGFGLPVLEAMACGTPVACSDIPSLKEIGGQAISYFDPVDPASAADLMVELLEDRMLASQRANEGLQRAARFSWEETARRTLLQYRALLG